MGQKAPTVHQRASSGVAHHTASHGKLNSHLAEIDNRATEMFDRLMKLLAEKEGINEQLKAQDQMAWVQRMNNIRNAAEEIVNAEVIFA